MGDSCCPLLAREHLKSSENINFLQKMILRTTDLGTSGQGVLESANWPANSGSANSGMGGLICYSNV